MKRLLILSFILALSLTLKTNAQGPDNAGFGYFYSSLSPYGTWIQLDGGVNVWRPVHMRSDWLPYKYGRWIWTDDGWYWDSDEPYGYIVFHYGRWYHDDYYGWIWVPDNVWAPAWVEWRYDNDYIGWAPLPPYATFSINFGIRFSVNFSTPYSHWHFVKYRYMCDRDVYRYYVPERFKYRVFSETRYRTNYGYSDGRVINRGVDVDFIRKRSGSRILERNIERVDNPRDLTNSRDRNSGAVRAYVVPKDQMERTADRNFEVKRGTRPSSLDVNRLEIGRSSTSGENRSNELQRGINRNTGREDNTIRQRPDATPRIDNRNDGNVRETPRNTQPDRNEQNINKQKSEERIFQREQNNEKRNNDRSSRPQIKRDNSERRAPETRRETRDNRNQPDARRGR